MSGAMSGTFPLRTISIDKIYEYVSYAQYEIMSILFHTLLFLLRWNLFPAALFSHANDITQAIPRRLRENNKIHSRGGILLCTNESSMCYNQRFQTKYMVNGRSYYFKKTVYGQVPDEEDSRPLFIRPIKRGKIVPKRAKHRTWKESKYRKHHHNWKYIANARSSKVANKSRKS